MNPGVSLSSGTKERILDEAEKLFSHNGYRGTSLRAITGKADVNLAAVNYHFGSKKRLLEEVIRRRIEPLNRIRKARIEEVRSESEKRREKPDLKKLLSAFIEPTLHFKEANPGAKSFFAFIGRSFTDPDETVRKAFMRFIKPMFYMLFEAACDALPEYSADTVFWRLHFTIGAVFHAMHVSENISGDFKYTGPGVDSAFLVNQMIPYVTAGMKAK